MKKFIIIINIFVLFFPIITFGSNKEGENNITLKEWIDKITCYNHTSLIDNHHILAGNLYTILKNDDNKKQLYNISESDLKKLHRAAIWGAVDAIERYDQKIKSTSPTTHLLPSLKDLKKNADQEYRNIPDNIRTFYINQPSHPFAKFIQIQRKNKELQAQDPLKITDAAHAVDEFFKIIKSHTTSSKEAINAKATVVSLIGKATKARNAMSPNTKTNDPYEQKILEFFAYENERKKNETTKK